jgi:hypothetical protein
MRSVSKAGPLLLPNGISAFRFADGNHYDPELLILGAEAIRLFATKACRHLFKMEINYEEC